MVRPRRLGEPVQVLEVAPQRDLTEFTIAYIPHDGGEPGCSDRAGGGPTDPGRTVSEGPVVVASHPVHPHPAAFSRHRVISLPGPSPGCATGGSPPRAPVCPSRSRRRR